MDTSATATTIDTTIFSEPQARAIAWEIVDGIYPREETHRVSVSHIVKVNKLTNFILDCSGSFSVEDLVNKVGIDTDIFIDDYTGQEQAVVITPAQKELEEQLTKSEKRRKYQI
jgi:hypothetical protein